MFVASEYIIGVQILRTTEILTASSNTVHNFVGLFYDESARLGTEGMY